LYFEFILIFLRIFFLVKLDLIEYFMFQTTTFFGN